MSEVVVDERRPPLAHKAPSRLARATVLVGVFFLILLTTHTPVRPRGAVIRVVPPVVGAPPSLLVHAPSTLVPSSVSCEPAAATGGPTCAFEHLYLHGGELFFAVLNDSNVTFELPDEGLTVSTDLGAPWGVNPWPKIRPRIVTLSQVRTWLGGAMPPLFSTRPVVIFSRLNSGNIYHHIWDDLAFARALVCRALALFVAARGGNRCVPPLSAHAAKAWRQLDHSCVSDEDDGIVGPGFHFRFSDEWLETIAEEIHFDWPPLPPPEARAAGDVAVIPYLVAGSQGACSHRRHCSNIIDAAPMVHFRRHLRVMHGITSPPPVHTNDNEKRTAVLVRRTGRRMLTNIEEIAAIMPAMGFEPRIIGPFADWSHADQYRAFANASFAVLVFGAELGPAWVGLPDGACAAVVHPAGSVETLSYWITEKVGIKVATLLEVFKSSDDPRLAPNPKWEGRASGGMAFSAYNDVWGYLFSQSFRIDPKDLWLSTWCVDAPGLVTGGRR